METKTDKAIPIDNEHGWAADVIKESLEFQQHNPRRPTIFKMPPSMRKMGSRPKDDLQACEPKLISIGPYHYGKSNEAVNELKSRLLHRYLSKIQHPDLLMREIEELEQQARDCYSEPIKDLESKQFLEMLLIDGVFLAELLHDEDDIKTMIPDNKWFKSILFQDLLLIENQLPFFIVKHLLRAKGVHEFVDIKKKALDCFVGFLPQKCDEKLVNQQKERFVKVVDHLQEVDHLLQLFHKWILHAASGAGSDATGDRASEDCEASSQKTEDCEAFSLQEFVPTATELADAGVEIKVKKKAHSFLRISFCKDNGVLEIPSILVYDGTYIILRNLVAWEQCCCDCGMDITHYVCFMDHMIDTSKDVELLYRKNIINRGLSKDEDVASVFNRLSTNVAVDLKKCYLAQVCNDINSYNQLIWPTWRAKLVHDYFSNPWAIISLVAAIVLLGMTILQAVYSVLSYY